MTRVLLALLAGIALGAVARSSGETAMRAALALEPIGALWINSIRMTVVPLVASLLATGVASHGQLQRVGRLGVHAFAAFVVLLLVGGTLAALVALWSFDRLEIDPSIGARLREDAASNAQPPAALPTLAERFIEIVPSNPLKAAADGAMLPLVTFTLLFSAALTRVDAVRREPIVQLFQGIGDAMLVVIRWVLSLAPIGIFALALGLGVRMGSAAAGALLHYVATLSAAILLMTAALYPIARLAGGVPMGQFARAVAPAQAIALSSRSSLAALPAVVAGARDRLGLPAITTGFAIPLAVSVFRLAVPMAWVVGALFLSKLYGVELSGAALAGLLVTATLVSFSVPGIPSGGLFVAAPALVDMGLPAEGVGILIAVDAIPDMFKTVLNVTSHLVVAAALGREKAPFSPTR